MSHKPTSSCPCTMCQKYHRDLHETLHQSLDELVADYVTHTGKRLRESTIMDLIQWSHAQTITPTVKS